MSKNSEDMDFFGPGDQPEMEMPPTFSSEEDFGMGSPPAMDVPDSEEVSGMEMGEEIYPRTPNPVDKEVAGDQGTPPTKEEFAEDVPEAVAPVMETERSVQEGRRPGNRALYLALVGVFGVAAVVGGIAYNISKSKRSAAPTASLAEGSHLSTGALPPGAQAGDAPTNPVQAQLAAEAEAQRVKAREESGGSFVSPMPQLKAAEAQQPPAAMEPVRAPLPQALVPVTAPVNSAPPQPAPATPADTGPALSQADVQALAAYKTRIGPPSQAVGEVRRTSLVAAAGGASAKAEATQVAEPFQRGQRYMVRLDGTITSYAPGGKIRLVVVEGPIRDAVVEGTFQAGSGYLTASLNRVYFKGQTFQVAGRILDENTGGAVTASKDGHYVERIFTIIGATYLGARAQAMQSGGTSAYTGGGMVVTNPQIQNPSAYAAAKGLEAGAQILAKDAPTQAEYYKTNGDTMFVVFE